jgi:hypothetical protein
MQYDLFRIFVISLLCEDRIVQCFNALNGEGRYAFPRASVGTRCKAGGEGLRPCPFSNENKCTVALRDVGSR